ncbi:MAG: hypothetical protein IJ265_01995, partial [Oscillospiraceae bacterium]|nr:hypothetical protein [Oscillospiraceae bacterium]
TGSPKKNTVKLQFPCHTAGATFVHEEGDKISIFRTSALIHVFIDLNGNIIKLFLTWIKNRIEPAYNKKYKFYCKTVEKYI